MLSPINQLIGLISPASKIRRGKIVSISSGYIKVATDTKVIKVSHIAGYIVGQYVLLNPDDTIKGKTRTIASTPIYVV